MNSLRSHRKSEGTPGPEPTQAGSGNRLSAPPVDRTQGRQRTVKAEKVWVEVGSWVIVPVLCRFFSGVWSFGFSM